MKSARVGAGGVWVWSIGCGGQREHLGTEVTLLRMEGASGERESLHWMVVWEESSRWQLIKVEPVDISLEVPIPTSGLFLVTAEEASGQVCQGKGTVLCPAALPLSGCNS